MMRQWYLCALCAVAMCAMPALAQFAIDGAANEPMYGERAVQDTQTNFGNASLGRPDITNGSEIDVVYSAIKDGNLYLVLAGNLETNGNKLEIFFDTRAGGQNRLLQTNPGTPNVGLLRMSDDGSGNGLTFASGFEADFWVSLNVFGDPVGLYVDYAELYVDAGNPGVLYYCGAGATTCATSGGALTGGDAGAPTILATVDNTNVAGVDGGTGNSIGSGVTTGIEFCIPLAAIGNPAGAFTMTAFVNGQQHDFVSNQVVGGIGGWVADNLGDPRNLNLATDTPPHVVVSIPAAATPVGACCMGTACSITTEASCTGGGGTYLGDNTTCDGNPCNATPQGACCFSDTPAGRCEIMEATECANAGGVYQGDGTTCEGCPCLLEPTGACCTGNSCSITTEADCLAGGGDYIGNFTNCDSSPCEAGACCVVDQCYDVRRFECDDLGGTFFPGIVCDVDTCAVTIDNPHSVGSMQGWDPTSDPMTETGVGTLIYERTYTGLVADERHEWKVTNGLDWGDANHQNLPGPNSWFFADGAGEITLTYDANTYNDGWLPQRDRLGTSTDPGAWTVAGDMLSELGGSDWNNADPAGAMTEDPPASGLYNLTTTGLPRGNYSWKGVVTGSWDSISVDTRSVNTANASLYVPYDNAEIKFELDALAGRVRLTTPCTGVLTGDANCDAVVDLFDIDPFVIALTQGQASWEALYSCDYICANDCNQDGVVDLFDIDPFVTILTGP